MSIMKHILFRENNDNSYHRNLIIHYTLREIHINKMLHSTVF